MKDRDRLILAILVAFNHKMSKQEMADLAGISRSTFNRIRDRLILSGQVNGHLIEHLKALGYRIARPKVDSEMDTKMDGNIKDDKKVDGKPVTKHPPTERPTEEKRTKFGQLAFGTEFDLKSLTNISSTNNTSTTPAGRRKPLRDRNTKQPCQTILKIFDQVHFDTHDRGGNFGDVKVAAKQAQNLLDRGFTLDEIEAAIIYYHTLEDDWCIGHVWRKFVPGIDQFVDRARKDGKLLRKRPELDQDLFDWVDQATEEFMTSRERFFQDKWKGRKLHDKADKLRKAALDWKVSAEVHFKKDPETTSGRGLLQNAVKAINDLRRLIS